MCVSPPASVDHPFGAADDAAFARCAGAAAWYSFFGVMPTNTLHQSRLAAAATGAVAFVLALSAACGEPAEPQIPEGPDASRDGADATDGPAPVTACFGIKDGTPCEDGKKICVNSICAEAACGDGILTVPEECDRGALNAPGSGCETTCKHSCAANDAPRNCASTDPCIENGTCDEAKHACTVGSVKASGASCGPSKSCKGGACVDALCGDAVVTAPEQCDNGAANGPKSGCESDCTFSCENAATDCATVPCTTPSCSAAHSCQTAPDLSKNGQACGSGLVCNGGACIAPGATCGNGILEGGEDCDFGGSNAAGSGCEINCKFSCTKGPDSCTDVNACHAAPTCTTVSVGGKSGQKCVTGADKADGATCGVGSICIAAVCAPSVCGDSFRDGAKNEECDDGNIVNLDACDSACKFEHDHRVVALKMQFGTDAYCAANALGGAVGSFKLVRDAFQKSIDDDVKIGAVSSLFAFAPGADLSGTSGPVSIGSLSGDPTTNAPPYDGQNDMDWWYTPNPTHIDGMRRARAQLAGSFSAGTLDATGSMNLIVSVGGGLANLAISSAKIRMKVGTATTPATAAGAAPPGHLASEHLLSSIKSFSTAGNTFSAPSAQMCGNVSATSLNNTPVPLGLLPGGENACNENYAASNRLLDVLVNGCKRGSGILTITVMKPTQPDQVDPAMPAAGQGAPYALSVDGSKRVTACKDKSNAVVPLQTCLDAAAYSSSFKYATDRVIIR